MPAYLTSINFVPGRFNEPDASPCQIEDVEIRNKFIAEDDYNMRWDFFERHVDGGAPQRDLSVMFVLYRDEDPNDPYFFSCLALPFFSNEVLRKRISTEMSKPRETPKVFLKNSVNELSKEFQGSNPLDLTHELRSAQEKAFLSMMREHIDIPLGSEAETLITQLHHNISVGLTANSLHAYTVDRPLVLLPHMQDHIFFRDNRALQSTGGVTDLYREGFGYNHMLE